MHQTSIPATNTNTNNNHLANFATILAQAKPTFLSHRLFYLLSFYSILASPIFEARTLAPPAILLIITLLFNALGIKSRDKASLTFLVLTSIIKLYVYGLPLLTSHVIKGLASTIIIMALHAAYQIF